MEKITRHPDTEEIENGIYQVFENTYMLVKDDTAYLINPGLQKMDKKIVLKKLHFIFEFKDKNAITKKVMKIIFEGDKNV